MTQHTVLTSSQSHEPKHITDASIADAGQVITPNGTGTSELRALIPTEVGIYQEYGEMHIIQNAVVSAVTGATADITLYDPADYTQITTLFTAGDLSGMTFATSELTVLRTGMYFISGWLNTTHSVNNSLLGFKYTLNGTPTSAISVPTIRRKHGTGLDIGSSSGTGMISLTSGDKVGMAYASDTSGNIVFSDGNISLQFLK